VDQLVVPDRPRKLGGYGCTGGQSALTDTPLQADSRPDDRPAEHEYGPACDNAIDRRGLHGITFTSWRSDETVERPEIVVVGAPLGIRLNCRARWPVPHRDVGHDHR